MLRSWNHPTDVIWLALQPGIVRLKSAQLILYATLYTAVVQSSLYSSSQPHNGSFLGVDFAVVIFKRSVEKYFVLSGTPKRKIALK